jgi:hypothetical protein
MKYPVLCFDQASIRKLNHGLGYPLTLLVDGSGTIRFIKMGGSLKTDEIKQTVGKDFASEIERLLKE